MDYQRDPGINTFIKGGKSGLLAAVMQCLISAEPLVKLFLIDLEMESKMVRNQLIY